MAAESALERLYRIEKALDEYAKDDEEIMQGLSKYTDDEMAAFDRGLNYMARHPSVASNDTQANPYPDGLQQDAFNAAVEIVRLIDKKIKETDPGAPLLGKYAMGGPVDLRPGFEALAKHKVPDWQVKLAPYVWNGFKWVANNLLGFNLKAKGGPIVVGKHKGFRR